MNKSHPERQLSSHELGFQDLDTSGRPQVVSGVVFLDGNVSADAIWERVQKYVDTNPQFHCCLVNGERPAWKLDSAFDISNHCEEISLNHSATGEVLSFVSNAAAKGLDKGKPPWRIGLLRLSPDSSQDVRCAIAIWAHHSLIDGLQGMKLYSFLQDGSVPLANCSRRSESNLQELPEERAPIASGSCARAVAGEILRRPPRGPFNSRDLGSANRTTLALEWTRESFKRARRQTNASFQEVLLSLLTEALAQYSHRRGLKRDLRALLPLGRSEKVVSSLTTNRHDIGFIRLPTLTNASKRCDKIRMALMQLRREQELQVFPSILELMARLPKVMRRALSHRFARQADLLISLIPGGHPKDRIGGARVSALFAHPALPPGHAMVVGITVSRGSVCVTVQVDPKLIDCSQELKECFERAYQQTVVECGDVPGMAVNRDEPKLLVKTREILNSIRGIRLLTRQVFTKAMRSILSQFEPVHPTKSTAMRE